MNLGLNLLPLQSFLFSVAFIFDQYTLEGERKYGSIFVCVHACVCVPLWVHAWMCMSECEFRSEFVLPDNVQSRAMQDSWARLFWHDTGLLNPLGQGVGSSKSVQSLSTRFMEVWIIMITPQRCVGRQTWIGALPFLKGPDLFSWCVDKVVLALCVDKVPQSYIADLESVMPFRS